MKILLKSLGLFVITSLFFSACQKETSQIISENPDHIPVANAGPSKTITLPVNTVTLTGSGTSLNGPIVGYLWSLISGPNVPVIQSPSSPSTIISGMIAGHYHFQFIVIDSLGYTGVDTVSVTVIAPPIQTLTLQPSNSPNELTMWFYTPGNYSDPASPEIDATAWTSGGNTFNGRDMFKFDLSSIPAGATILSAKLTLYSNPTPLNGHPPDANYGPSNAMYIERVNSNWTSTTLWQNQPGTDVATQVLIPQTSLSSLDLVDVNVTSQVSDMKTIANYGFMIRLQTEVIYNIRDFCSSRYSDATKHPKLVITYY